MKRLVIAVVILSLSLLVFLGLPVFAQTYVATLIPGQPLSMMAAEQIITNSGLPREKLPDGTTNSVTRGRDAVNSYRYAHQMLYENGWYRGISEDHTPLLEAMVDVMEKEGYMSSKTTLAGKTEEVLQKFWYASDTQNAKDLGYSSLEDFHSRATESHRKAFEDKWK